MHSVRLIAAFTLATLLAASAGSTAEAAPGGPRCRPPPSWTPRMANPVWVCNHWESRRPQRPRCQQQPQTLRYDPTMVWVCNHWERRRQRGPDIRDHRYSPPRYRDHRYR